jgi:hypothetical protein
VSQGVLLEHGAVLPAFDVGAVSDIDTPGAGEVGRGLDEVDQVAIGVAPLWSLQQGWGSPVGNLSVTLIQGRSLHGVCNLGD